VLTTRSILVQDGNGIEHPGVDLLHLRVTAQLIHDALVVLVDLGRAVSAAFHRVLYDRLPLQLLGPCRQLVRHGGMLRLMLSVGGSLSRRS
jgi:hypothetical protein